MTILPDIAEELKKKFTFYENLELLKSKKNGSVALDKIILTINKNILKCRDTLLDNYETDNFFIKNDLSTAEIENILQMLIYTKKIICERGYKLWAISYVCKYNGNLRIGVIEAHTKNKALKLLKKKTDHYMDIYDILGITNKVKFICSYVVTSQTYPTTYKVYLELSELNSAYEAFSNVFPNSGFTADDFSEDNKFNSYISYKISDDWHYLLNL